MYIIQAQQAHHAFNFSQTAVRSKFISYGFLTCFAKLYAETHACSQIPNNQLLNIYCVYKLYINLIIDMMMWSVPVSLGEQRVLLWGSLEGHCSISIHYFANTNKTIVKIKVTRFMALLTLERPIASRLLISVLSKQQKIKMPLADILFPPVTGWRHTEFLSADSYPPFHINEAMKPIRNACTVHDVQKANIITPQLSGCGSEKL